MFHVMLAADGHYTIPEVAPGLRTMEVSESGYITSGTPLPISADTLHNPSL